VFYVKFYATICTFEIPFSDIKSLVVIISFSIALRYHYAIIAL